jgi:hypothetical protein
LRCQENRPEGVRGPEIRVVCVKFCKKTFPKVVKPLPGLW